MYALIDGEALESRRALHDALARQLALPEWYGRNLDALFDCLTDLHERTEIRVIHGEELRRRLGGYAGKLLQVLHEAADENHCLTILEEDD